MRFYCDPDNVRPGHNCIRIDFYLAVHATCVDCYDPAGCGEKFLFVRLVEFLCAYEESPSSKPSSSCVNEVNTLSRNAPTTRAVHLVFVSATLHYAMLVLTSTYNVSYPPYRVGDKPYNNDSAHVSARHNNVS